MQPPLIDLDKDTIILSKVAGFDQHEDKRSYDCGNRGDLFRNLVELSDAFNQELWREQQNQLEHDHVLHGPVNSGAPLFKPI